MARRQDAVPVVGAVPRYGIAHLRSLNDNGRLTLAMGRRMAMQTVADFWSFAMEEARAEIALNGSEEAEEVLVSISILHSESDCITYRLE